MTRLRFWVSQFIWLIAVGLSGLAASEGDAGAVPFFLMIAFILTGFINHWGNRKAGDESRLTAGYNGHIIARVLATVFIWVVFMGGMVAAVTEMSGWGVLLALIMMVPALGFTAMMWLWERMNGISIGQLQTMSKQTEKRKRHMTDVLGDLSEAELRALRARLGDLDADELHRYPVGDDGELMYHESKIVS